MRIKQILKEKGLTQKDLAERLGVTRAAVAPQIAGRCLVSKAEEIAAALEVPTWQLFADPEEICTEKFFAVVQFRETIHNVRTLEELEQLCKDLRILKTTKANNL